jgi:hypothetical protein
MSGGTPVAISGKADTVLTTKGDIVGYDTVRKRIGIGINDQVLTADSTNANGLAWKTGGSLGKARAIGSDVLSTAGTSLVLDSLDLDMENDYSSIQINVYWITAGNRGNVGLKINDKTSYDYDYIRQDAGTMESGSANAVSTFEVIESGGSGSYYGSAVIIIHNFRGAGLYIHGQNALQLDSSSLVQGYVSNVASTITKIEIISTNNMMSESGMMVSGILQ